MLSRVKQRKYDERTLEVVEKCVGFLERGGESWVLEGRLIILKIKAQLGH